MQVKLRTNTPKTEIDIMLKATEDRDKIAAGMWARYNLKRASKYTYDDPRFANGVPIFAREKLSAQSINQKLHVPFDREIVSNKVSYFASNIQLILGEDLPEKVKDFYTKNKKSLGFRRKELSLAKRCVDQGTVYILCFYNKKTKSLGQLLVPADRGYIEYDEITGEALKAYRYDDEKCDVYGPVNVTHYTRTEQGSWIKGSTDPHGLGTRKYPIVPMIELRNNPEYISNPEMTVSLMDGYDTSFSDLSSEIAQIRNAYLLLKGTGADTSTLKDMLKESGVIVIDEGSGDAKFISKDLKPEAVKHLQNELRKMIFEGASSYDPTVLTEGTPPTAFEINSRFHGLEMDVEITAGEWDEGLALFDMVVKNYLRLYGGVKEDYDTTEIQRIFRRTAPKNMLQALVDANAAGMKLSEQTKWEISQLPIDVEEEKSRLERQPDYNSTAPATGGGAENTSTEASATGDGSEEV